MFCGKCGSTVRDGAAFCPKCGNKFSFTPPIESTVSESPTVTAETPSVQYENTSAAPQTLTEPTASLPADPPKVKKRSAVPIILFIALGILLVLGIGFGIWMIANSGNNNENNSSSQVSAPVVAVPEELPGRWEYNVSYTDLPIGKPLDTAFDAQLSGVRYRLSVEFGEDSKAYLLLYKADVESAATGIFEILRDYRISELYQSYYNSDELSKEEVEHIIFEREHMTVSEYVSGQMKVAGLDKESILKDITAGLPELDGRTWIYMECKYRVEDGVVHLETKKGDLLISFVMFLDEGEIKPYEANDTFGFLVKAPGEEISFLKKNK